MDLPNVGLDFYHRCMYVYQRYTADDEVLKSYT